jgi:hypothetical protein
MDEWSEVCNENQVLLNRIAAAKPAMSQFVRQNPKYHLSETRQDPCGVRAWIEDLGA